ncbi:transcriptional activator metR [Vibrio ishigakensis]|uniref:HTH-type transcriptional regulator MetR n=1 Tax=Vibrio ishigakensis TaxID=1481914 RepID=A0A0B8P0W0_9VIBR|nr:LysR substrate-binding domain-containing protein [Vibrio ishigakensis]GAM58222.1 transcriptional activator metR [Vibrio ishigakensis]
MIELKHLRTMRALQQHGSLSACAESLHITQSAVSHQVKELEVRIGAPLFYRKTKPLKFTSQGERLVALAHEVLPKIHEVELSLKEPLDIDSFTLAIDCHSCFQWLLPTIKKFQTDYPNLSVDLESGFHQQPLERLLAGEIDLMITSDVESRSDLHFVPLFGYELQMVFAKEHEFETKDFIEPSDLTNQTLLTYPVEKQRMDIYNLFLKPANLEPKKWKRVDNTATLLQMVSGGFGVAALPDWAVRTFEDQSLIATCKVGESGIQRHSYAAVRIADKDQSHIADFVQRVKQHHKR